ncbi:MAG: DNA-3-methyladenine glycosylase [Candidatus Woesebacteria bacterium GW2011_GWA1_37_7]|uniref:DNA-3-methyladenine glycosylase II n=1 Tax=Candidatus Woesebacteria bacterium GW2011_GWA1_37_7 TaxID=1618545 RepID=A0A0G0H1D8_9BACT|nr:MAG: DNA-3-methyladenine glycosylase [Candidatus Woesebacteria bacterium GW2011_GWA1_37_7]
MWEEVEEYLLKDKYIGPLIKKYGHCKIKPKIHADYFQELIGDIIGQQLSGRVADVIYNRLKNKVKGNLTPGKILALNDQELRDCGMAWAKVRSIKDLADKVKNNKLHLTRLDMMSDAEVMKELTLVKGIGRWTAEMFLMFTLGRPDIFPDDDLGIRKGLRLLRTSGSARMKKEMTQEEMVKFVRRWKPYRTVASWYLWALLDNR